MASFASSATTCGARKHAWTKKSGKVQTVRNPKVEIENSPHLNYLERIGLEENLLERKLLKRPGKHISPEKISPLDTFVKFDRKNYDSSLVENDRKSDRKVSGGILKKMRMFEKEKVPTKKISHTQKENLKCSSMGKLPKTQARKNSMQQNLQEVGISPVRKRLGKISTPTKSLNFGGKKIEILKQLIEGASQLEQVRPLDYNTNPFTAQAKGRDLETANREQVCIAIANTDRTGHAIGGTGTSERRNTNEEKRDI